MLSLKERVLTIFLICLFTSSMVVYRASAATTTLAVDPSTTTANFGTNFNVNITVANVFNFTSWQFRLYFLNGIVNCTGVTEGAFLKTGGGTFFNKTITNDYNGTYGRLLAYCSLLGFTSVNGSGVIATVNFKAIGSGDSPLHLADTKLGDEKIPPQPIPHTDVDGLVTITGGTHDIALTNVTHPKTIICQNYTGNITATVENHGAYAETFMITLRVNNTIVETKATSLNNGDSANVTFVWDTTTFVKGNYGISANATIILGETNTADNNFTDSWIKVTIVGDVNGDGKVNLIDVFSVALAYGSYPGHPTWNPNYDINNDGKINLIDYFTTALHYGQVDP